MKKTLCICTCALLLCASLLGCGRSNNDVNDDMSSIESKVNDTVSDTVSDVESGISSVGSELMPNSSK